MQSKYENAHAYFNFAELMDSAVQTTAQRYRQKCIQVSDYICTEIYGVNCDKDGQTRKVYTTVARNPL
jgi:hypothetical protein